MLHTEMIDVHLLQEKYDRQKYITGKTPEFLNAELAVHTITNGPLKNEVLLNITRV
jgi:hypothetical protein